LIHVVIQLIVRPGTSSSSAQLEEIWQPRQAFRSSIKLDDTWEQSDCISRAAEGNNFRPPNLLQFLFVVEEEALKAGSKKA
jgi:hypothetical protein